MKIIKHGIAKKVKFKCPYCKCVFLAHEADYTVENVYGYTTTHCYVCDCPDCGSKLVKGI